MLLQFGAYDVVLHADELAFIVSLLALSCRYDRGTVGTIGRAIGLWAQHASLIST